MTRNMLSDKVKIHDNNLCKIQMKNINLAELFIQLLLQDDYIELLTILNRELNNLF